MIGPKKMWKTYALKEQASENKNVENIKVFYVDTLEIAQTLLNLQERFNHAKTVQGTRSFHSFEPIPNDLRKVTVRKISKSSKSQVKTVMLKY